MTSAAAAAAVGVPAAAVLAKEAFEIVSKYHEAVSRSEAIEFANKISDCAPIFHDAIFANHCPISFWNPT